MIKWLNEPVVPTYIAPTNSKKPGKCVMSMDSKLRKVETYSSLPKHIPFDQNIRLVTSSCSSLNDLGKLLMRACGEGNLSSVEALMSKGAPFLSDWLGTTPLHIAVQHNHPKIVQRLLIGGISKDCRNKVDRSALHMASDAGYLEVVKVLVNRGADVNCIDMLNMTPLHWAVQNGHFEIVKYLLTKNVKIDYKNKFNLTALDIANQINRQDIISLIKNATEHVVEKIKKDADGMEFLSFDPPVDEMLPEKDALKMLKSDFGTNNSEEPINLAEDTTIDIDDTSWQHQPEQKVRILHSEIIPPPSRQKFNVPQSKTTAQPTPTTKANENNDRNNTTNSIRQRKVNILRKQTGFNPPKLSQTQIHNDSNSTSVNTQENDALRLLQKHGISLMTNDDVEELRVLDKAIENGHSVVLTDAGKEIMKSIEKAEEDEGPRPDGKRILTVTPEEFLQMMNRAKRPFNNNVKVLSANPPAKKMVMNKNKLVAKNSNTVLEGKITENIKKSAAKLYTQDEMDVVVNQLVEAKKTIEEYKLKLTKKEQEAERYKKQLKLLMDLS